MIAKNILPRAANDNRHDQSLWDFMHTWLDFWLKQNQIVPDQWPYNRSIHYTYELKNRSWLPERDCTRDVIRWLDKEAESLGIPATWVPDDAVEYAIPGFLK